MEEEKRVENEDEESDDEVIGPMPATESEAPKPKKRKIVEYEEVFIDNLPSADYYEKSYMHRDSVTHIAMTKTDFLITASTDGHVKFWKKQETGIEFVKHFRSHLGNIQAIAVNNTGSLLATTSNDKSMKVFDIVNFDMINMIKLNFIPQTCEWIHTSGDAIPAIAVSEENSEKIRIYDGQGGSSPIQELVNIHSAPVHIIVYNPIFETVISSDTKGMIEYWTGPKTDYLFPKKATFESKLDTNLFEFVKTKSTLLNLTVSPNGEFFACLGSNRKIYVFRFKTGKLLRVFDESLSNITELQSKKQLIPPMEFGRRMAVERDVEKSDALLNSNMVFDESSNFLLYPTVIGVKVVNHVSSTLVKVLGKPENLRILQLALFQGKPKKAAVMTAELEAAENPTLDNQQVDPTLFCTAFKKNRFYMFTRRDAHDVKSADVDRDVFNEKPSKEDIIASIDSTTGQRLFDTATIHTTKGDITLKLFGKECPKSVENFCVHAKDGYYNGHIFHRVIKGFMVQTGDPAGIGTGGESIWGGEFEDEFHPSLKHDRPYTLSMANAGPNTNGSQFFVTLIPTPWLDNKHTVFGRVTRGMETVQNISMVKTNPKTDKPYDDVSIVNISVR